MRITDYQLTITKQKTTMKDLVKVFAVLLAALSCPSCDNALKIGELFCDKCETRVSGAFDLPSMLRLSASEQEFVMDFVKSSGSLKTMAVKLGLSYPTVRNLLDEIIEKLNAMESGK